MNRSIQYQRIASSLSAQLAPGNVSSYQKISKTEGNLFAVLEANDQLGRSVTLLGDVNGDGIQDIAAGALSDDDGGTDRGAVYVIFLDRDGTVIVNEYVNCDWRTWFSHLPEERIQKYVGPAPKRPD